MSHDVPGAGGPEDLLEGPLCVHVEMIQHQSHLLAVRVASLHPPGHLQRPVRLRATLAGVRLTPARQRLEDSTEAKVRELFGQYAAETGQTFDADSVDRTRDLTHVQPWLMNALAAHACFEDRTGWDRS